MHRMERRVVVGLAACAGHILAQFDQEPIRFLLGGIGCIQHRFDAHGVDVSHHIAHRKTDLICIQFGFERRGETDESIRDHRREGIQSEFSDPVGMGRIELCELMDQVPEFGFVVVRIGKQIVEHELAGAGDVCVERGLGELLELHFRRILEGSPLDLSWDLRRVPSSDHVSGAEVPEAVRGGTSYDIEGQAGAGGLPHLAGVDAVDASLTLLYHRFETGGDAFRFGL